MATPNRVFQSHGTSYSVYNLGSGTTETGWPSMATLGIGNIADMMLSPDRTRLAVVGGTSPYLKVIDVATKAVEAGWPTPAVGGLGGVAWSHDGSRLAVFGGSTPYVAVIDVATKAVEAGWAAGSGGFYDGGPGSIIFSPSDDRIVACRGQIDVWVTSTKARDTGWPTLTSATCGQASFSPDGTDLALAVQSTGATENLIVIDVASKTAEAGWPTLNTSTGSVRGIDHSPDGTWLVLSNTSTGSGTDNVAFIDVATKSVDASWPTYSSSMSKAVRFSSDGSLLATGRSLSPDTLYLTTIATQTATSTTLGSRVDAVEFGYSLGGGLVTGFMTLN